jgi:hypothetical protein
MSFAGDGKKTAMKITGFLQQTFLYQERGMCFFVCISVATESNKVRSRAAAIM